MSVTFAGMDRSDTSGFLSGGIGTLLFVMLVIFYYTSYS